MSRYPSTLPCPTAAPVTPTERRLLSDIPGKQYARGIQRDFHGTQSLSWIFTAEQAAIFDAWWKVDLYRGGAWFAADWPLPRGNTNNVYRFQTPPSWSFVPGGPSNAGMFRVSAEMEIRGRGELPFDEQCVLLMLRMEGEEGGTTFVDSSIYNHTVTNESPEDTVTTAAGGVVASGKSMYHTGALGSEEGGLSVIDGDLFNLTDSDVTVEGWVSFDETPTILPQTIFATEFAQIRRNSENGLVYVITFTNLSGTGSGTFSGGISNGTPYYFRFTREGQVVTFKFAGQVIYTVNIDEGEGLFFDEGVVRVGASGASGSRGVGGYVDEFRLSRCIQPDNPTPPLLSR